MNARRGLAISACVLLNAAGCSTDQQKDVDAYRAISDVPGAPALPEAPTTLTLVEALRLTAAQNERLAIQGELYVQALADRQRTASSLLPTIDLFSDSVLREGTSSNIPEARTDAGVTLQYRFLTGLSDVRAVNAADARIRSNRWLILDLREALLLECARAYYETLRAERLTEVLRQSVKVQDERLVDARARNVVGFTRPLDVAQIEAQASETRTRLMAAENQVAVARSALELLTGAEVGASVLSDEFTPGSALPTNAELLAIARKHRQDLLSVRADADEARALVDAAIGQRAPSVALNLDYFLLRDTDPTDLDFSSLISVRLPVFAAGRIDADVRSAWSVFRERVLRYRLLARQVRRDTDVALADHRTSLARVAELRVQVAAARQALELAEASYLAGLGTNLERIAAQDQLLTAELTAASEEFTVKTTYLGGLRACGALTSELLGAPLPTPEPDELVPPESPVLDRAARPESDESKTVP